MNKAKLFVLLALLAIAPALFSTGSLAIQESTYQGPVVGPTLSVDKYQQNMARLLPKTRACLAKSTSGYRNCIFGMSGDSTNRGLGANNTGSGNSTPWAVPSQVAIGLQAAGIPATWQSFFGAGISSADITYDNRVATGSWTKASSYHISLGGYPFVATNATGGAMAFTPKDTDGAVIPTDTCIFYYIKDTATGTITFDNNGANSTAVATAGTNTIASQTVTTTKGNNTCNANWTSGTNYMLGIRAIDSTQGAQIYVDNYSAFGMTSTQAADVSTPTSPGNAISLMGLSLLTYNYGINDWVLNTTTPVYQTNVQSVITTAKNAGIDFLLITPNPTQEASISAAVQNGYVSVERFLAVQNNVAIVDNFASEGSWGTPSAGSMNALELVYDGNHPDRSGYKDMAQQIVSTLLGNRTTYGPPLLTFKVPALKIGTLLLNPPASGTPSIAFGTASGTIGAAAAAPITIDATTGTIGCPTCGVSTVTLNTPNGWTGQQYNAASAITFGATTNWDWNTQCTGTLTATGNFTLANPTNVNAGSSCNITVTQDGTGSRVITWGSNYKFPGGAKFVLSTTAGAVDVISCLSAGGTNLNCVGMPSFN